MGQVRFIGTNLVENLLNDGCTVKNLDKKEPPNKSHLTHWEKVDILNLNDLGTAIKNFEPDMIIHLAAVTDLDGKDLNYYAPNIAGTQNIIDTANKFNSIKKIIFTSSMDVCKPGFIPQDY